MGRSVAAKLFALVFLVLVLTLGVLGYLNVRLHRTHLEASRVAAARQMSDVINRSTSYYMMRNDRAALRHIVETIAEQPGIDRLRIMDAHGRVGFAGASRRSNGHRVLYITRPIANSASCATAACHAHSANEKTLGQLELQLSLADTDAALATSSRQFAMHSALAILVTLAAIGLFVWRFVGKPVSELRIGTELIGSGNLGVQIPEGARDELGDLARSFNLMSRQLREARDEITAWTQTLEDRVQTKSAELQAAQRQMIQAEKLTSLGKLAAVVAHEINNPLSGILTYAKLLRKWNDRGEDLSARSEEIRDALQLIESESRRCGDIVRNLLAFGRAQPLQVSDVDVNSVLTQCLKLVEHKLRLGNIALVSDLDPKLPLIRGDAGHLEQLFLALIMNAIDAMPHEGTLRVTTAAKGDEAEIAIEDDGIGIAPDILSRLFEPFVTTKEVGKGVGLGLAISRGIVERHRGHIAVKSQLGRGTTFTITLPRHGAAMPLQVSDAPQEVFA